ncbi:hypothetical protein TSAR_012347 [Trichomalopsis sarcophagae]|uniref:DUF4817 domain-containing protein n=1 Tax=Trichomalopsis sarcophagae TaxID=543379 RepID=A0A232EWK9_9HYME|nr:hypothetical protein TSAR_012347 [Trichomalopsis sarcophagae]
MQVIRTEYAEIHLVYGACNEVGHAAAAEYRQRYPNRRHPDVQTFTLLHQRLVETVSFEVRNPDGGRQRGARDEFDEAILDCFAEDPTTSLRRTARFLETSYSMCQRVMKEDGQHPHKSRCIYEIMECDRENRMIFSHLIVEEHERDPNFLDQILWTDESTHVRTGMVNPHNEHHWAHQNSFLAREDRFQHKFSINMWAELFGNRVVGPWELPDRLDGHNYLRFLREDLPMLLDEVVTPEQQQHIILMHDGAPAHFAIDVSNHLDNLFPGRWIGRGGPTPWPARSADLNPLDYFYWGNSKESV